MRQEPVSEISYKSQHQLPRHILGVFCFHAYVMNINKLFENFRNIALQEWPTIENSSIIVADNFYMAVDEIYE